MERIQIEDIDKEIIHDYVTNGGWGTSAMLARLYNRTPQAIHNFNKIYVKKNDKPIGIPNNCPFNDIEERDQLDKVWDEIGKIRCTGRQKQVLMYSWDSVLSHGKISFVHIAQDIGLSEERVRQIFEDIKRKIRKHWYKYGYRSYINTGFISSMFTH